MTELWAAPVDLDNCAAEPIHVPGAIQPHGVLIAVTEPALTVAVSSTNLSAWFGIDSDAAVGMALAELIGQEGCDRVDRARRLDWVQRHDELVLRIDARLYVATLYRSGPYLVIELERDDAEEQPAGSVAREASMALQASRTVLEVAAEAARWIRSLTEFDRVMVYRFDADWNGEVIAEHKRDDLNTFLGLHYPSTDIPAQARELYRRNWLRVIPDVAYRPVSLFPAVAYESERPLDLSASTLRSVSPIHIEYLTNMGVGASMSVSIVINGALWGLIACHHYSGAHRPGVIVRNACEFLAQLISLRLAETIDLDTNTHTLELSAIADQVADAFAAATQWSVDDVLQDQQDHVLELADASGVYVFAEGLISRLGSTPPDAIIADIVAYWPENHDTFHTEHLSELCPAARRHLGTASGVLALALTSDRKEFALWFRAELVRSVEWGGDPHNAKIAAVEADSVRLSPRKSFDLWRETISGHSQRWNDSEVRAAQRFARHLGAALLRRERDSATLAKDLQRVMRPAALPSVPGYDFGVYFEPAGKGGIGGDWYDAFTVEDHLVVAVIGDVAGHGLEAASEMAQLRNTLRGFLIDRPDPADALQRLDRVMLQVLPGSIATCVCSVIDTSTNEMLISHAGHPPALRIAAGLAEFLRLDGDQLLGFSVVKRNNQLVRLQPGEIVVLYSDGLVETRLQTFDTRLDQLKTEAIRVFADPSDVRPAAHLAARLTDHGKADDITVLFVQRQQHGEFRNEPGGKSSIQNSSRQNQTARRAVS